MANTNIATSSFMLYSCGEYKYVEKDTALTLITFVNVKARDTVLSKSIYTLD